MPRLNHDAVRGILIKEIQADIGRTVVGDCAADLLETRAALRQLLDELKSGVFDIPKDWSVTEQVAHWQRANIEETGEDYQAELHDALLKAEAVLSEPQS